MEIGMDEWMDKQMDGLAEGRWTEGFGGWMDGRTDL